MLLASLRIGVPVWKRARIRGGGWAVLGALSAVVPAVWMWGFTVDDALISARYAAHLSLGLGFRFNAHGPSTDGVTPLPWPFLLVPLASSDLLVLLARTKALGLVGWTLTAAALGYAAGRRAEVPAWRRVATFAVLALSVPLAAHAVSGMETPLATLLATSATLSLRRPRLSALLAGLAASLRPEMEPWAMVLTIGACTMAEPPAGLPSARPLARALGAVSLAIAPFLLCVAVRVAVWGHPAPLAVWAKPSDLDHGLAYAGAACVVTLVPFLVLAPWALRRSPVAGVLVAAGLAHVGAVVAVGGDWMPYARLLVPILPSLAYAAIDLSARAAPLATALRHAVALIIGVLLIARGGTSGRTVGADRTTLVLAARPALASMRRVAGLDVGWLGAATNAEVVDLAGVTDPAIAVLPGGHTSKRVSAMLLLGRDPDALLFYAPFGLPEGKPDAFREVIYTRTLEARLANDEVVQRHFAPVGFLPLGATGAGYVVWIRQR